MKDKIIFLKFNNYINPKLSSYLSDKLDYSISEIIDYIKNNFDKDEVIPTILNTIEDEIESKKLITFLDLINYYISIISIEKIPFFKKLILEKLQKILIIISKPENRSIVYQFMIDYSALYDFDIKSVKKRFPIDRDMFLKKVVELATSKSYLRFLLMYEVSIFFNKNEINNMWLTINTFSPKEKELFFKIFYNCFNQKNQRKIFKFLIESESNIVKTFIPTLNFFTKEKELYFKNILSLTSEEFHGFDKKQIQNGLFSQTQILFSPKNQNMIFLSEFFDYKKYTVVIELDFNLNHISSKIIKQPILFNRSFFVKNYKNDFKYEIKIDPIIAKEIFLGIIFKLDTSNFPQPITLLNYFTFKNTLMAKEYQFIAQKDIKIQEFHLEKKILTQIIKNNLHRFIDINELIPNNISHKKSNIKLFLETPIFREKFDKYIKNNKLNILNSIKLFAELSKSLEYKKDMINFFILLYRAIENTKSNLIEIPQLKHLILFYLNNSQESKD